jgi:hypothetical protein
MRILSWAFVVFILAITAGCLWLAIPSKSEPYLIAGQLLVLSTTLIVLIKYAYDTNRIADANEKKWEQELQPLLIYAIPPNGGTQYKNTKFAFILSNPTIYFIDAIVYANFKIYGEAVSYGPPYDGGEAWELFPKQDINGVIDIQDLLSFKEKTIDAMIKERTADNKLNQLTLELSIKLINVDTKRERNTPVRRYWFDFERWLWIPYLTRAKYEVSNMEKQEFNKDHLIARFSGILKEIEFAKQKQWTVTTATLVLYGVIIAFYIDHLKGTQLNKIAIIISLCISVASFIYLISCHLSLNNNKFYLEAVKDFIPLEKTIEDKAKEKAEQEKFHSISKYISWVYYSVIVIGFLATLYILYKNP